MSSFTIFSASSIIGNGVKNEAGEDLGKIEDIMLDVNEGRVSYAVLSFGGFLGIGDKYFAVPWGALALDTDDKCMLLNESKERLEKAPGFNKDRWPDFADRTLGDKIYNYYGTKKYW